MGRVHASRHSAASAAAAHHTLHGLLQHATFAHFAHLLHHVRHLALHLHKFVQIRHLHAGTFGDPLFAGGLKKGRVGTFFFGHGLDQGDLLFQHLVVKTGLFDLLCHFTHAGHHAHHALHAAHLDHLLKLHLKVVHIELTFGHALHHALGLFGLDRVLGFFN